MTTQIRTLIVSIALALVQTGALTAQIPPETEKAKTTAPAHGQEIVCACNQQEGDP